MEMWSQDRKIAKIYGGNKGGAYGTELHAQKAHQDNNWFIRLTGSNTR